jgi:hypothetical protein
VCPPLESHHRSQGAKINRTFGNEVIAKNGIMGGILEI